ncbi:hypothetical protein EIMP300_35800 [Escherichia coli]|uniref:Uncharacterized protein n=1 Tax=Escherichia coli TaxID=562 RepID=A0A8S0FQA4_ECOLX|nr:hypothetical protein EIMP300_35800 [Escherichia coli]
MKRLIMATMVTAILASSTVWAADNAPVAAQQQTQQVKQTQKTAAAERMSASLNKVYMRCVTCR